MCSNAHPYRDSDAVFGIGSLSALIVLKTPGNAARVDPVEGRGKQGSADIGLTRALAKKDNPDGPEQDKEVEKQIVILYVVKVVLKLLHRFFYRPTITVSNLRPTGDSRWNAMPYRIERNLLRQRRNKSRPLWAWTNETHLTFENVNQLR